MPYSRVSLWMTLSILEWLSKIFNDTKLCVVCLQQLSFLLLLNTSVTNVTGAVTTGIAVWLSADICNMQHCNWHIITGSTAWVGSQHGTTGENHLLPARFVLVSSLHVFCLLEAKITGLRHRTCHWNLIQYWRNIAVQFDVDIHYVSSNGVV